MVWKLFWFSLRIHAVLALDGGMIFVFSAENIFSRCENVRGTIHVNYAKMQKTWMEMEATGLTSCTENLWSTI